MMTIKFYKEDDKWYADIPQYIEKGGAKKKLEMVDGVDTWLTVISEDSDEITLKISTEKFDDFDAKLLYLGDIKYMKEDEYLVYPDMHYMCLKSLITLIFGGYPQSIYYKQI